MPNEFSGEKLKVGFVGCGAIALNNVCSPRIIG